MIRFLTKKEAMIAGILADFSGVDLGNLSKIPVFVVDQEYGSLRASDLSYEDIVEALAECYFEDSDGVLVCVTLFLCEGGGFGELVFWKGDGSPISSIPDDKMSFHSFQKIPLS